MAVNRLRHISIKDNISFKYNNDVMRQCFNGGGTADYGQYPKKETGDGCEAWFPKEREWRNGEWKSGSREVNWKNHIEEDGLVIISELNEGEKAKNGPDTKTKNDSLIVPKYTFWKVKKEPYRYIGTYLFDVNASIPRYQVFRRIDTEIDLTPWYEQQNFSYLQDNNQGKAVYKNIYINGSYTKQRKLVDSFWQEVSVAKTLEKKYVSIAIQLQSKYSLNNLTTLDESGFRGYLNDIQKIIDIEYGQENHSALDVLVDISFPEIGQPFIGILNNPSDHNTVIRESKLGQDAAGKILGIYNPQYYIYGLSEELTDYYLKKLKAQIPKHADLTEKHCLLYFWKQCNEDMNSWSPFIFVQFLEHTFGNPYRSDPKQDIEDLTAEQMIDQQKLYRAFRWFLHFNVQKSNESNLDFKNGWLYEEEGYKEELFANAHQVIDYESWDEEMIGSGLIIDCVIDAFNAKDNHGFNNIVDYHSITKFRNRAYDSLQESEDILYRLYKDESPARAFDEACTHWGKWYPELSYLLFIKDKNKYLPVKTSNHIDRFKRLGIDTLCLDYCSWSNYRSYLLINEEIRRHMEVYFGMNVSLLDAHSFVWMTHYATDGFLIDPDPLFKNLIDDTDPYVSTIVKSNKEGKVTEHYVTKYERNPKNRAAAIKIHGYCCAVCGFDFSKVYGELGKEFIEVHHVRPLYSIAEEVTIDPKKDLVCLCANCHRMIHRKRGTIMSVQELRESLLIKPFFTGK